MKDVPVILVVEDDEPLPEIVHDALKEGGFDLTTVASGQEAVAMIESGVIKYSALVTDVNLEGPMKGWEIARLVRQIDPAFPIVYMTGAAAHGGCCRRRLGVGRRAQQHSAAKAVCSSSIGYGCPSCSTQVRRPNDSKKTLNQARLEDGDSIASASRLGDVR